jgi:hypothetical protein
MVTLRLKRKKERNQRENLEGVMVSDGLKKTPGKRRRWPAIRLREPITCGSCAAFNSRPFG